MNFRLGRIYGPKHQQKATKAREKEMKPKCTHEDPRAYCKRDDGCRDCALPTRPTESEGSPGTRQVCAHCGGGEFRAQRECRADVIVTGENVFERDDPREWGDAVADAGIPYGPYACKGCGREAADLDDLVVGEEDFGGAGNGDNETRSAGALAALQYYIENYCEEDGLQDGLVDLLTNLRHMCAQEGLDFAQGIAISGTHHEEEIPLCTGTQTPHHPCTDAVETLVRELEAHVRRGRLDMGWPTGMCP